jgi:hypothetical protein
MTSSGPSRTFLNGSKALRGMAAGPLLGILFALFWAYGPSGILAMASLGFLAGTGVGLAMDTGGKWPFPLLGPAFPAWYRPVYAWGLRLMWGYAVFLPGLQAWAPEAAAGWVRWLEPLLRSVVAIANPLREAYLRLWGDPLSAAVAAHGYAAGVLIVLVLLPLGWIAVTGRTLAARAVRSRSGPPIFSRLGVAILGALGSAAGLLLLFLYAFDVRPSADGGFGRGDARDLPLPFSLINLHLVLVWLILMVPGWLVDLLPGPKRNPGTPQDEMTAP